MYRYLSGLWLWRLEVGGWKGNGIAVPVLGHGRLLLWVGVLQCLLLSIRRWRLLDMRILGLLLIVSLTIRILLLAVWGLSVRYLLIVLLIACGVLHRGSES